MSRQTGTLGRGFALSFLEGTLQLYYALRDNLRDASLNNLDEADIDRVVEADGSINLYLQ